MTKGICTLANDAVFDQVIALINSIEVYAGSDLPICIYPYDDNLDRLRALAAERPQVQVFEDWEAIAKWDAWTDAIWAHHPSAATRWLAVNGQPGIHRKGTHRRLCAFDGPFDEFIYMDADTLLLQSPDLVFDTLTDTVDWVTYDFQHKDLSHVFDITSEQLSRLFSPEALRAKVFCSGFYGTKKSVVTASTMDQYLGHLAQGEAEVLYPMAPDQTVLNYFVLRKPIASVNLALTLPSDRVTGNSVTSTHFEARDQIVFDQGKRLLYLHYIGISSKLIARLCQGENLDIPYRDTFLHYRFLHAPDQYPTFEGSKVSLVPPKPTLGDRCRRKISRVTSALTSSLVR
jgi:hypothetical protein